MRRTYVSLLLLLGALAVACSEPARIAGFDSDRWKSDRYACENSRQAMQSDFDGIRRELYGLKEPDIIDILGKPDGEQLMARGQRIFYYYIEPGSQCNRKGVLSEANRVEVRFNALSRVSEITYARPLAK
ncbi:hypothetical protein [Botryobacter ruber]|uniref:hypothetical protein n=1 Tax=Botryobacter ruber TaxID=2171629 RepID=UPI000E0C749D|nr:hypothetical protein [Botryobacter ruber]